PLAQPPVPCPVLLARPRSIAQSTRPWPACPARCSRSSGFAGSCRGSQLALYGAQHAQGITTGEDEFVDAVRPLGELASQQHVLGTGPFELPRGFRCPFGV